MKPRKMILTRQAGHKLIDGKITPMTEEIDVIVLAIVGVNAMVRRPGCAAFVANTKDLKDMP